MRKKLLMYLAMVLVIPGLLFTTSCSKKEIFSESSFTQEEAVAQAASDKAMQEGLTRQQAIEEQRLESMAAAKDMFLTEDIFFEFDSAVLLVASQKILGKKAKWLTDNPEAKVTIEGHCDERGTNEYNLALGDRRAESAKTFLMDLGVQGSRLSTISYGEECPMDSDHNEEAWAKNRRGHFILN